MSGQMKFSPDGRYIAFDLRNDIDLLSTDGKTEGPLVRHPANDRLLGWTPDGHHILFASDRSGAIDAWILPVAEGRPGREPELLRKDIGEISPLGLTRDGAFFYGHSKDTQKIYLASLDRKAGAFQCDLSKSGASLRRAQPCARILSGRKTAGLHSAGGAQDGRLQCSLRLFP